MKVGDLVRLKAYPKETGIIVRRFTKIGLAATACWIDILMHNGFIRANRNPSAYEVMPP